MTNTNKITVTMHIPVKKTNDQTKQKNIKNYHKNEALHSTVDWRRACPKHVSIMTLKQWMNDAQAILVVVKLVVAIKLFFGWNMSMPHLPTCWHCYSKTIKQ